jgi:hypothetical protein
MLAVTDAIANARLYNKNADGPPPSPTCDPAVNKVGSSKGKADPDSQDGDVERRVDSKVDYSRTIIRDLNRHAVKELETQR